MKGFFRTSLITQFLLALYLQIIEWVDLFPWNDVRHGNGQEVLDIALAVATAGAIIGTYKRWRPVMYSAIVLYSIWLALQVTTFWIAYATGASERWQRIYEANFGHTVQWLPRYENHLPPDASHFVLQLLLVAALVSTISFVWCTRATKPRGSVKTSAA